MTTLVFGGNGQVGQELLRALAPLGEVQATTRIGTLPDGRACLRADFADADAVVTVLDAVRPTRVVNAAAYTAVDKAESDADAAQAANATTPGAIAHWCAANDVPLVHVSLIGTYFPLWIMSAANIFTTLLFKNNFDSVSISLIEAARIDGCSDFKTFWNVLLPLSVPVLMVAAIRIIVGSWSGFLWPMLVIKDEDFMPVTVKLYRMKTQYQLDQYMLALVFGMIPPTVLYIIFQKHILGGQKVGGVKE